VFILPLDLFYFVNYFCGFGKGKKVSKGLLLIWNAVIWTMWQQINQGIFDGRIGYPSELLDEIITLSWK
jgi:hypothetical protein